MNRKDRKRLSKARQKGNGPGGGPPRDITSSLGQITALLQGGHPGDARALCQSLLEEVPDDPQVLNLGAIACFQTGDSATAVSLLESALEREPGFVDAHNNLGNVFKAEGDLLRAEKAYRSAIHRAGSHGPAGRGTGHLQERPGHPA
jgi:Flp pilus assembly protein TadD